MARRITVDDVAAALDAVARERGRRTDDRVERKLAPRYVEHGQPCCLVAVVLHRLGFTIGQLKQFDAESGPGGGGIILSQSRHPLLKRIEPLARQLLVYVQRRQDMGGEDWPQIVDRALQRGWHVPDENRLHGYHYDKAARMFSQSLFPWNAPTTDDQP